MSEQKTDELVKRIARLAKENKDLSRQLKEVSEKNENLSKKADKFEAIIEELPASVLPKDMKIKKKKTLRFKMATVLFVDIQGFSQLSDNQDSRSLIDELDQIYIKFETLAEKYQLETIKTIGDTYICAGGIPVKNRTNPVDVVMAGLEIQRYLYEYESDIKNIWGIKIGIHTGQVTASVSGKKKLNYDIKGETVNIASRMGATSRVGEINISAMTYELIKEFFVCEYYGKMPVKYQGDLEMFFVKGLRPEFTKNEKGLDVNAAFNIKFGLIQFGDLQELILDRLERELPAYLYYHNAKHTIDVVTQVELIGWGESVTDEEILLLKTAGLFHDAGHTIGYDEHEYLGCQIVREMLPEYNYTPEQIDRICDIIMATKLPPRPTDKLQSIICDSDLDYLGRSDFIPVSNTLYKELKEQNKMGTLNQWNKIQVKFISGHQYFTQTARSLREVNKQKQIERIQKLIVEDKD